MKRSLALVACLVMGACGPALLPDDSLEQPLDGEAASGVTRGANSDDPNSGLSIDDPNDGLSIEGVGVRHGTEGSTGVAVGPVLPDGTATDGGFTFDEGLFLPEPVGSDDLLGVPILGNGWNSPFSNSPWDFNLLGSSDPGFDPSLELLSLFVDGITLDLLAPPPAPPPSERTFLEQLCRNRDLPDTFCRQRFGP